jgi:NitT/TauT family transport system substrate-binding protein
VISKRSVHGLVVLVALTCAGLAGAAPERQSATALKVCYANAATDFTPAFVAKNEGFFSRNGLDVSLILASGGKGSQFLTSGICDLSLDSATPNITANEKGADVVLLGVDANTFDFRLVAKSSIPNVKGLAGKTLALSSPGAAVDIAGQAMLKSFGLGPSDLKIVYISSLATRLAALQSGSIDAMIISPPIGKVLGSGAYKMIYNLKGLHFILSGMFAKRSFAQSNVETIKAYIRSDVQAIAWMKNPANKAKVLADVGAVTGFTEAADVEEAYEDVLSHQQPEPLIDPRALTNSVNWVEGQLKTTIDPNGFLYLGPLQQVLTRHLTAKLTARGTRGSGTFTGTVTPAGVLSWRLTSRALTGPAVYAEVHRAGSAGGKIAKLRLCGPCKANASGTTKVYSALLNAFKRGSTYVTVSTAKHTAGEIRGTVAVKLG